MKKIWPMVKLGDVLTPTERGEVVNPTNEYRLLGIRLDGKGPFLRETLMGTQTSASRLYRVQKGDFIYSRLFACRGAFGVISEELDGCYVSGEFPTFVPIPGKIDVEYLKYWFRLPSVIERVDADCSGSTPLTRNRFKEKFFLELEIPLPPLAEQQRLVKRIEELTQQINEARNLREEAVNESEALFSQYLDKIMTPHDKNWKRETIKEVIISMDAGWSPQCDDVPAHEGEWGVLKTTSVQWCEFQPKHNKRLPLKLKPIPELTVKKGDVLVTRAGPRKRVAVIASVRNDEPRLTISDKLIRLRVNKNKIEPRFLELSLSSPFSQEHLVQRKTGLADAQVNISQAILRATPIAYPSLPEQHRIVDDLDTFQKELNTLKQIQNDTVIEITALVSAILDKGFKGQL